MSKFDYEMICLGCVDKKKYAVIGGKKVPLCTICGKVEEEILAVTKECQAKFIEFNVSWAMNNISKTIDMHLIPRIKEAKDREDIQYCQGMLDAFSDFLTDKLYAEILTEIYSKRLALGTYEEK